jgi:hypothetical protein
MYIKKSKMAGGLLNISAVGDANVILTGNPTKTYFKVVYSKHTNFGLQKFRIDFQGLRDLRLNEESQFSFKIPRYADLLMDTYISIRLPDIWSPIYHPCIETNQHWAAYDFRWIRDLGSQMIKEVTITCGGLTLQKYSGEYLSAMVDRDFNHEKKSLYNQMTGNIPELYDLANAYGRMSSYPSAYYIDQTTQCEPSFRSRYLYIPINTWFTLDSRCAFPLICLQYNELVVNVTIRPIRELFQVRDVFDYENNYPYVQPDFNLSQFQMYRFLQSPPGVDLSISNYDNKVQTWNSDIHLIATDCFLSEEERQQFAMEDQVYLVKDVFEYNFDNVLGSKRVKLTSNGMISNWMWYFQRNDANLRNEWSNYTNWPYITVPVDIQSAPMTNVTLVDQNTGLLRSIFGPLADPNGMNTGYYVTGAYTQENIREIMMTMGIVLDGAYRENMMESGVFNYIEKYMRTAGYAKPGLYCYNFCLNTSPFKYQPSGAINLSKFKNVELEITTIIPAIDAANSAFNIACDTEGVPIAITKQNWRLYEYTFNMKVFEERYNVLSFISGNCGMLYAR